MPAASTRAPARPPRSSGGIEAELGSLRQAVQAHRKRHRPEAAALALATVASLLLPAGEGSVLASPRSWAFLLTAVVLVVWIRVGIGRYRQALEPLFDQATSRVNALVADPSERLVYRSQVARLRAEWLAPRKFFEAAAVLRAALVLYLAGLVAGHAGPLGRLLNLGV